MGHVLLLTVIVKNNVAAITRGDVSALFVSIDRHLSKRPSRLVCLRANGSVCRAKRSL